jgi:uncharacterized protein
MSDIVHFEIPFDNAERARKFYTDLFGWKVEKAPGMEYWTIATQDGTYGGMMRRFNPDQKITDYFGVSSVLESSAKVAELGGKILVPKMPVPTMGDFAVCMDTEGNIFGLWEADAPAIDKIR